MIIDAEKSNKHWKRGYVSGTFDMFHVGHLNLLRKAKERCDFLTAGVLSDESVFEYKGKLPVVPLADRLDIVQACRYVDAVDVTTKGFLNKVAAWEQYHFDAMFSGDDHLSDGWAGEADELDKRGADLVFFPYTQNVSSSELRQRVLPPKGQLVKVITYGTFDVFHSGHRKLLERAKALGEYLIVGVTSEQYDIQRGKLNVSDNLVKRIDAVRRSGYADEIIIEETEGQKASDIQKYGVDVFVIGSDWQGKFDYLKEYCKVVYLERTKHISSSEIRDRTHGIIRLGLVGAGRIAKRMMDELRFVSGINPTSVFNPNPKSAEKFGRRHVLEPCGTDYQKFLNAVDAVYIASPHGTHYEYAKQALLNGKHVLCEKPMVLRKAEAEELFSVAKAQNAVLMEAIKTAYSPGFQKLIDIARSGKIGTIYDVESTFTKLVPHSETAREYDPEVGGSFTELASYPLLPIIKLLGNDFKEVRFESFRGKNGVDIYAKAYFRYEKAVATAKTGIGVKSEGQLLISGTEGYILVKSPWWLIKNFEICYENTNDNESFSAPFLGYGLRYEMADFVRNINRPEARDFKIMAGNSVALAMVFEKFRNPKIPDIT
jgi:glycerol-3-phosphate cytidylyltransferase